MSCPDSGPDLYPDGSCLRIGVLTNPRSGGNKKGLGAIHKVLAEYPEVLTHEAFTPEDMAEALADFAQNQVDLVVLNGGDGTIHAAMTAIGSGEIFATPPLLALLCAGTTSMSARDVGIMGSPAVALQRILVWAKSTDSSLKVQYRPVLRVQRDSHQPPLIGMFFGAGAICQGIKVFHSGLNPMGWRGELMPGLTLLRMLIAILFKDQSKVPPLQTMTSIDDQPPIIRANLFVLISTLERLFLGLKPYWGTEAGPLHYTATDAEPRRLLRILPSLFRLKKNRHIAQVNGYFSHNACEIQLEMQGDFTLDGELYDAGQGPVRIDSAGTFMFLC